MFSIDQQELEEKNKPIEIELQPISKWKRMLVFLGDFFICFFLSFLLLNVLVNPIASVATNASARSEQAKEAEKMRDDLLYHFNLLFFKDGESSKYNYDSNLKYTFKRWLSYYALDEMSGEYGNDINNEVIYTYYHSLPDRVDDVTYLKLYTDENKSLNYFDITGNTITLKEEVKVEVKLAYIPNEKMGGQGEKMYNNLSSLFAKMYRVVMEDIFQKDLVNGDQSFSKYQQTIQDLATFDGWAVSICILIAYVLSWIILHIVYPLIAKNGHTVTMSIMKVERIGTNNLNTLSKLEYVLYAGFSLILEMGFLMFMPLTYGTSFVYAFTYPLLSIFSITSIFICLVSVFVMIFNSYNRTLSDLCSRSVIISRDDLDELYAAKQAKKMNK